MRKFYFVIGISLVSILLTLSSCKKNNDPAPVIPDDIKYTNAIKDAMVAEESEISHNLIAINDSNNYLSWTGTGTDKKVLVVTWTKYPGSFPVGTTITNSWGTIWVTVVPEIKDWYKKHNYPAGTDFILRTEQLMGLSKNRGYTHFAELWVKPQDLYRPSPDNEITDNTAQLNFPPGVDSAYKAWFNGNIIYSYYPMSFPWTRLGYTYDWCGCGTEIGMSEFVIKQNSQLTVNRLTDNATFFSEISQK
ncbi:MAG: hypothetical protein WCO63_13650 [Bacteroidota bacterium]